MNRSLTHLATLLMAWVGLSSVSIAATDVGQLSFRLETSAKGEPRFSLWDGGARGSNFNSNLPWSELQGINQAALASASAQPVRFSLVREAGRIDCSGTARGGSGSGTCKFTADQAFASLLAQRGIGRVTDRDALGLTLVGAKRQLLDALSAARYATPNIGDFTGLAALNVTSDYIADLSARGYRPERLSDLIAFKALGVTPAYVEQLRSAGFGKPKADEIVQLKALEVSPAYLASLGRVGYDRLPVSSIIQLKALDVTADYIAGFQRLGHRLSVNQLVQCKAMGIKPEDLRNIGTGKRVAISADELIQLKVAGLLP